MFFRKEYEGAKHQLAKGEEWFRNTLSPIVGLQHWTYVGFIAFPNLEDKGVLKRSGILNDKAELLVKILQRFLFHIKVIFQNVITKEEMNDINHVWWNERMNQIESVPIASGLLKSNQKNKTVCASSLVRLL